MLIACALRSVRKNSPAAPSSNSDKAICATTSALRKRERPPRPDEPRASFSAGIKSAFDNCSAGAMKRLIALRRDSGERRVLIAEIPIVGVSGIVEALAAVCPPDLYEPIRVGHPRHAGLARRCTYATPMDSISAFRRLVQIIERRRLKAELQTLISNFRAALLISLNVVCNGVELRYGRATHPVLFGFGKTESQERALALIYWRLTTDN